MGGAFDRLCTLGPVFTGRVIDLPLPVKGAQSLGEAYPKETILPPELAVTLSDMMFLSSVLTLRPQYNLSATHSPAGGFGGLPYKVFVYRTKEDVHSEQRPYGLKGFTTYVTAPGGLYVGSSRVFSPPSTGGVLGGGWIAPGLLKPAAGREIRVIGVWSGNRGVHVVGEGTSGWESVQVDNRGAADAVLIGSLSYPLAVAYTLVAYRGRTVLKVTDAAASSFSEAAYADPPTNVIPTRMYWVSGSIIVVSSDCMLFLRPAFSGNTLVYDAARFATVVDTRYFAQLKDFVLGVADGTFVLCSTRGVDRAVDQVQQVVVPGDPRYPWSSGSIPTLVSSGSGALLGISAFGYRTSSGAYRTFLLQELERNFCMFEWTSMPGVPAICDTDLCFYDFDVSDNDWLKVYTPSTTYSSSGVWETGFIAPSPGRRVKLRSVTLYGDSGAGTCDVTVEVRASDDGKSVVESYGPAIHVWSGHALQVPLSLAPREWYQFSWKFNKSSNLTSPPYVLFWRLEVEGEV
jgi:hypothetical protein